MHGVGDFRFPDVHKVLATEEYPSEGSGQHGDEGPNIAQKALAILGLEISAEQLPCQSETFAEFRFHWVWIWTG